MAIAVPPRGPGNIEPLFAQDIFLFRALHLPHLNPATFSILVYSWWGLLFFAAMGFLGRPGAIFSWLLGVYLMGERMNFGMVFHEETPLLMGLFIMAFAPFRGAFGVCSFLREKISRRAGEPASSFYFWPIQLLRLFLVYILFSAALWKLILNGRYWILGNVVHDSLAHIRPGRGYPWIVRLLDGQAGLCRGITLFALAMEFVFPLVLVSRRMRRVLLPAAYGMLVSIWLIYGYHFVFYMTPLFLAWLPWEKLDAGQRFAAGKKGFPASSPPR